MKIRNNRTHVQVAGESCAIIRRLCRYFEKDAARLALTNDEKSWKILMRCRRIKFFTRNGGAGSWF